MNCKFSLCCRDRARRASLPNGFTLMELQIVIAIILILTLMAIPTIGVMKKHANEVSAINSLRAPHAGEIQYESTYPANGYACSLTSLAANPGRDLPPPTSSQLIGADLASGYKSGYLFNITNCQKVSDQRHRQDHGVHHHSGSAGGGQDGRPRILPANLAALRSTIRPAAPPPRSFCNDAGRNASPRWLLARPGRARRAVVLRRLTCGLGRARRRPPRKNWLARRPPLRCSALAEG